MEEFAIFISRSKDVPCSSITNHKSTIQRSKLLFMSTLSQPSKLVSPKFDRVQVPITFSKGATMNAFHGALAEDLSGLSTALIRTVTGRICSC